MVTVTIPSLYTSKWKQTLELQYFMHTDELRSWKYTQFQTHSITILMQLCIDIKPPLHILPVTEQRKRKYIWYLKQSALKYVFLHRNS